MKEYVARDYYQEAWRTLRKSGHLFLTLAGVYGAQAQYMLEVWVQTGGNGGDNYRANCAEVAAVRSWLMRENLTLCGDSSMHHMAWFYNRIRREYPLPLPQSAYDDLRHRRDPRVSFVTLRKAK